MSNSLSPCGLYSLPGSSVHEILQARILEGLPFPPPWDLPNPRIKPASLQSPALVGGSFTTAPPGNPQGLRKWYGLAALDALTFSLYFLLSESSHPRKKKVELIGHLGIQVSPQIDFSHQEFYLYGSEQVTGGRWLVPLDTPWPTSPF